MTSDELGETRYQKLRAAAHLLEIGAIVLIGVVFFLAPAAFVRGETEGLWEEAAGIFGIVFWVMALLALTGSI